MKVDEFLDEYKKLDEEAKSEYVKSIINTEYVSYATKIADCKRIIDSTSYTNTEPNMFRINSPGRYMLLNLQLVIRYADLEIDPDGKAMMNAYDNLEMVDALGNIINAIPSREVENYNRILDMMLKDLEMNERSLIGYLDSKLASLGIIGEALNNLIESTVESESEDMTE